MDPGFWLVYLFLASLSLAGCATPGENFPVALSYQGEPPSLARQEAANHVVVFPFEDGRADPRSVGRHLHVFGQVDSFESELPVGRRVAELLVTSLKERGWDARLAKPGLSPRDLPGEGGQDLADRVVTGTVQSLWAEAVSHFGYTEINAQLSIRVEIQNLKTGEKTTLSIDNQNDPKVLFFQPKQLQQTLNDLISSGLNRILP